MWAKFCRKTLLNSANERYLNILTSTKERINHSQIEWEHFCAISWWNSRTKAAPKVINLGPYCTPIRRFSKSPASTQFHLMRLMKISTYKYSWNCTSIRKPRVDCLIYSIHSLKCVENLLLASENKSWRKFLFDLALELCPALLPDRDSTLSSADSLLHT